MNIFFCFVFEIIQLNKLFLVHLNRSRKHFDLIYVRRNDSKLEDLMTCKHTHTHTHSFSHLNNGNDAATRGEENRLFCIDKADSVELKT